MTKAESVKIKGQSNGTFFCINIQEVTSNHLVVMYYYNLIVVSRMIPVFQKEIMHYRSFIN